LYSPIGRYFFQALQVTRVSLQCRLVDFAIPLTLQVAADAGGVQIRAVFQAGVFQLPRDADGLFGNGRFQGLELLMTGYIASTIDNSTRLSRAFS